MPPSVPQKPSILSKIFNIGMIAIFALAIFVSFYFLYFEKRYDFIIEVPCDPREEECFERDCSNPDDCPPKELSNFKRYVLDAKDFRYCANEDCEEACEGGLIQCAQLECEVDEIYGEYCVSPLSESTPGEGAE